jgi:hypothetical protein
VGRDDRKADDEHNEEASVAGEACEGSIIQICAL